MTTLLQRVLRRLGLGPSRANETVSEVEPVNSATPDQEVRGATAFRSDSPIVVPEQDEIGIDAFAKAIARSIARSDASAGLVYAINGVWGSGKSSAVNLVLHHLDDEVRAGRLSVAAFNPWWFSTPEALTTAFFNELSVIVGKSLDTRSREALAKVGSRLSAAGPLLGGLASIAATPAAGAAVTGGTTLIERLTRFDTTIEKEHRRLSEALRTSSMRYLVVLDDIDRLSTDEALQVFKLVKSAGRLPNVLYLLAYDRTLAERMVAERFPSEGASYLEKVVQGAFDLPAPSAVNLNAQVLRTTLKVMGLPPQEKQTRFMNLFHDVVAPLLRTPRDAVRLGNAIEVTWPAVGEDVDRADFLALEALRVFRPEIHRAIRSNGAILVGRQSERDPDPAATRRRYDTIFLEVVPAGDREYVQVALRRLFPRLDAVWTNLWHGDYPENRRDRLVCTREHFSTYFVFGLADGTLSAGESRSLLDGVSVPGATAARLRVGLDQEGDQGGTRAALLLSELRDQAGAIADGDVAGLVEELWGIADDLNVTADSGVGPYRWGSNELRLYVLTRALLLERMPIDRRSSLVRRAAPASSLGWIMSFSAKCRAIEESRGTNRDTGEESVVDEATTEWLLDLARDRIRMASRNGDLESHPHIVDLLYRWRDRTDANEVRAWTLPRMNSDRFVVSVARGGLQEALSFGMDVLGMLGDRVASHAHYRDMESLATIIDVEVLDGRVTEMLEGDGLDVAERSVLERFRSAPDQHSLGS